MMALVSWFRETTRKQSRSSEGVGSLITGCSLWAEEKVGQGVGRERYGSEGS